MKIQAIAHSYWRQVKRGTRTFEGLEKVKEKTGYPTMQEQVRYLAKAEVETEVIAPEEYEYYIGEAYEA